MNLYNKQLPVIHLKPGELYIARSPTLVITVLGSCVSVTMFDRLKRIGGICHGILPEENCNDKSNGSNYYKYKRFHYVDSSIRYMIMKFQSLGIERKDVEIKIFGGSNMLSSNEGTSRVVAVGRKNIQTALQTIEEEHLSLIISDVGGTMGRKIYFYTHKGEILLKKLRK
ncbi:MAG: chemotaxis protein CheD [Nitrospirota bacterium]